MSEIPPEGGFVDYPRQGPGGSGQSPNPNAEIRFNVISEAMEFVRQQLGVWIGAAVVGVLISFAFNFAVSFVLSFIFPSRPIGPDVGNDPMAIFEAFTGGYVQGLISSVFSGAITGIIYAGLLRMAFKQLRGGIPVVGDLLEFGDRTVQFAILGAFTSLTTTIGTYLCCLPGIILGALFVFAMPAAVDQNISWMDAVKTSVNALKSHLLMTIIYTIVIALIMIVGVLACCVGIFYALPVIVLSTALLYRDFFWSATEASEQPPQPQQPTEPPPATE